MRICIEQPIAASAKDAQDALLDAAFYQSLGQLEGISAPQLRSLETRPGHATAVVGYRFSGQLSGPAAAILDPAKLTWVQVSDVDLAGRRTEVRMVADNYANLLSFSGWYELRDDGERRCMQHFEAALVVHLPLLGPLAERAMAGSVRKNIEETAHLVERYVATRQSGPA